MIANRETREQRIVRERREMNLRPWEFAPSEVRPDDEGMRDDGSVGYAAWRHALEQRAAILARDPDYFHDDLAPAEAAMVAARRKRKA